MIWAPFLDWVKSIQLVTTVIVRIAMSPIKICRMTRFLLVATTVVLFAGLLLAQVPAAAPQPSLADVARQNREQKRPKAKVVVTEDTITASKGPIPEIRADATDNSDDIVAAIDYFRSKHTAKETETAVRDWFDSEDSKLSYDYSHSEDMYRGSWPYSPEDRNMVTPQQYRERELAANRAYSVRQQSAQQSSERKQRLQSRLLNVRTGIRKIGLNYEWFKVRCSNADCSY
jgi:hypothetical protein